ncbi:MAG: peptidoglycan DD-metalloendopeptidase family protein [Bacillota bacterium]
MKIKLDNAESKASVKTTDLGKLLTASRGVISWMAARRRLVAIAIGLVIFAMTGLYIYSHFIVKPVTSIDVMTGAQVPADGVNNAASSQPDNPQAKPDLQSMLVSVDGDLVTVFGFTFFPGLEDYRYHPGIDLATADGSPVLAALSGRVSSVSYTLDDAYRVTIDHGNEWTTSYSQLSAVKVAPGQSVQMGEELGRVDNPGLAEASIGPHLHFEVREKGEPRDPMFYLKQLKPLTEQ